VISDFVKKSHALAARVIESMSGALETCNQATPLSVVPAKTGIQRLRGNDSKAGAIPPESALLWSTMHSDGIVIARSHRASRDARLSTGYGDVAIQGP
jgi:hypothetical protein